MDVRPGGGFVTRLSDDGVEFVPHLDAIFLVVDEFERTVFTNAIDSAWRPAKPYPGPGADQAVAPNACEKTNPMCTAAH